MSKSFAFLSIALAIVLSACQTPPAPATPTAVPSSPTTAPTPAPTTAPGGAPATPTTAAPASPTTAPTGTAACTDSASFVADVTISDYSHFSPRETFTKTWRVKNTGTCTWTAEYKAIYASGSNLGAPLSIPLSETAPGATLDISADMAAPGSDGKYQTFYELTNTAGTPMPIDAGNTLWVLITVGNYVAYAPATVTPTPSTSTASTVVPSSTPTGGGPATVSCVTGSNADLLSQLVTLINAARTSNGLPALTGDNRLSAAAQAHSEDMACNNFLAHSGWNGSTPDSRIAAAGFSASITRENIYAQPPQYGGNAQAAVTWWMSDQIHREAILNPQVTQIGVGYATYPRSDLIGYFTVDFAAP